jgi:hypothetical protein
MAKKKEPTEAQARKTEQEQHDAMPDSDYAYRVSGFDHYVGQARGLDPNGVVGR